MTPPATFGLVVEPQHWSWADNISQWKLGEELGFDSIWLNDHFHSLGDNLDNPAFEASVTFAALAMATTKPKIGVLTYGNTHRIPPVLFKEVVTIDHMSGGRVIFGIGAGWNQPEHEAYSIPFPSAGERVARLEEALEILKKLEVEERTTFEGQFYSLKDTPFQPKPVHGSLPILIGGGKPKMLRVIGRYADIWDSSIPPAEYKIALETIRKHATDFGRDGNAISGSARVWFGDESADEVASSVQAYHAVGVRQFLFKYAPDRHGIEAIPHLAKTVIPELRKQFND
ncbi:MAG TPA: LLM class flavin-dependent oxidoreductase [Thermomicrobiales bacterium]|nr:LLM class flavin-dependent oxidoreductase [Thermomicrobiales bacterium]HRA47279.1 LLM class flavin-dependent oxidoreductase [Thermomicrobiales bacterium]